MSQRKPASRDFFSFRWTVRNWSLFLAHPTHWWQSNIRYVYSGWVHTQRWCPTHKCTEWWRESEHADTQTKNVPHVRSADDSGYVTTHVRVVETTRLRWEFTMCPQRESKHTQAIADSRSVVKTVKRRSPAKTPLRCGRRSSQGCSAHWKTGSGKGEEGVPVRGVIKCGKVYDIARWGVSVFGPNADNVLCDLSHAGAWGHCVTVHYDNKTATRLRNNCA